MSKTVRIGDLWENRCAGKPTRRCRVIGFKDGDAMLRNRATHRMTRVRVSAFTSSGHWYLIRSGPTPVLVTTPASVPSESEKAGGC